MINKVFIQNYLTINKYGNGIFISFFILALCFIFSGIYWGNYNPYAEFLVARPESVFVDGEYWRLITTIFVHGDLKHLLSNSTMLLLMSYFVYSHFGTKVYPFLSIIMGGVVNIFVLLNFEHEIAIVGISGVVYFLWGFWLTLYLKIQRQVSFPRRLMKVLIVGGFLLFPQTFEVQVSHMAHFLGLVLGILNGIFYYLFYKRNILSYEKYEYQLEEVPEYWNEDEM
jgi:rhomboid protease GluP